MSKKLSPEDIFKLSQEYASLCQKHGIKQTEGGLESFFRSCSLLDVNLEVKPSFSGAVTSKTVQPSTSSSVLTISKPKGEPLRTYSNALTQRNTELSRSVPALNVQPQSSSISRGEASRNLAKSQRSIMERTIQAVRLMEPSKIHVAEKRKPEGPPSSPPQVKHPKSLPGKAVWITSSGFFPDSGLLPVTKQSNPLNLRSLLNVDEGLCDGLYALLWDSMLNGTVQNWNSREREFWGKMDSNTKFEYVKVAIRMFQTNEI